MNDCVNDQSKKFGDTLNLPRTDFPIRPNHTQDDAALLARWASGDLYRATFEHNAGKTPYILHDGPPYANAHIHLGTAYNKILKDITTKSRRMRGHHVPVTPGWDCHGLPIELKVTQEQPGLDSAALKQACRAYAGKWIDVQREEFKKLGVLMDWDRPYLTMDYSYEAAIMRSFGQFVRDGFIEKKNKTVAWCASCQTVLASAEIEYAERKDPSIYVLFPLEQSAADSLFPQATGMPVNLLIWTTTPWTLPLNRAVLLKPDASYDLLKINDQFVVMGSSLSQAFCAQLGVEHTVLAQINARAFVGVRAQHPFIDTLTVPVILDHSVSLDDGTACVHSAPGCGPEDYEVGVKNNLEIFSPLSPAGTYTDEVEPAGLRGMSITDGQIWVLRTLAERGRLLHKTSIRHSYPHCWRCRNGLMFRATKQWFCNLATGNLRERALAAVDTIAMIPAKTANRLKATLEGRLEWCLSRQRTWGVPIPALLCSGCERAYTSPELIERVAQGVEREGVEYWDRVAPEELMSDNMNCSACGGTAWRKEHDILDVWFDSGISHYAVLKQRPELSFPADVYFEGKDQHRGWFQSSLLTSLVLEGVAPMRTIATHGYTVDAKGNKMSKSLGNVVTPQEVINELGTDGLRLWVASIDYADDAVISQVLTRNVQEVYRKVRNSCRFALSNLYDFDISRDAIPVDELLAIDRYALSQLAHFNTTVQQYYLSMDYTAVFHALADYTAKELSARYFDIIKDRLYVEAPAGHARRSAQTVCWYILDALTRLIAPIMSFTAELIADQYQGGDHPSIHLQSFAELDHTLAFDNQANESWLALFEVRSAVLKAIEGLREQGIVKHPLESQVTIALGDSPQAERARALLQAIAACGQTPEEFFKEFCIVSGVTFAQSSEGLPVSEIKGVHVQAAPAAGVKCPRCWHYSVCVHPDKLCDRCAAIVG